MSDQVIGLGTKEYNPTNDIYDITVVLSSLGRDEKERPARKTQLSGSKSRPIRDKAMSPIVKLGHTHRKEENGNGDIVIIDIPSAPIQRDKPLVI